MRSRPHAPAPRWWLRWAVLFAFIAGSSVRADIRDTSLTIGQGWAVVHELHRVDLTGGVQEITFADMPLGVDLSTLVIRHRRLDLDLLAWRRAAPADRNGDPSLLRFGDRIIWLPASSTGEPAERETPPVVCTLQAPSGGSQVIELSYVVGGLSWRADYQVTVRGDLEKEGDPVSVDLLGKVSISNGTSRAFDGATIYLVGGSMKPQAPGTDLAAGFLMVTPYSPLARIWKKTQPESPLEFEYRLPGRINLAPRDRTQAVIASVNRIPARRLYAVDVRQLSLGAETDTPMNKVVEFSNSAENGLGRHLPEGSVQIYLSARRSRLLQQAWLPHTSAEGDFRVQLGSEERVTARRRRTGRVRLATGHLEESFEIAIANLLGSSILTDIVDKPEYLLAWDVVRSNEPYEIDSNQLVFRPAIRAHSEALIRYKLRIKQPL